MIPFYTKHFAFAFKENHFFKDLKREIKCFPNQPPKSLSPHETHQRKQNSLCFFWKKKTNKKYVKINGQFILTQFSSRLKITSFVYIKKISFPIPTFHLTSVSISLKRLLFWNSEPLHSSH